MFFHEKFVKKSFEELKETYTEENLFRNFEILKASSTFSFRIDFKNKIELWGFLIMFRRR